MRKPIRILLVSLVAAAAGLFAQPVAAGAATAGGGSAAVGAASSTTVLANWVPWDGFHITSAANCLARRSTVATTYGIPWSALRCDEIAPLPPCTGPSYWLLMVDLDQTFLAGRTAERSGMSSAGTPSLLDC